MTGLPGLLSRSMAWIRGKEVPRVSTTASSTTLDLWRTVPAPTKRELLIHYKELTYACATINAQAVASTALRLYVQTSTGQPQPKCGIRPLTPSQKLWLGSRVRKGVEIDEVVDHRLLDLLESPNTVLDCVTVRDLTQLYQELEGTAYWYLERDALNIPRQIWIMSSDSVSICRDAQGLPCGYKMKDRTYQLEDFIRFAMPNPQDPYGEGWSPARAVWESIILLDKHTAQELAWLENAGMPSLMVSPKEPIGPDEAERLEYRWMRKFRRGGAGRVLVGESAVTVSPLNIPPKDLEVLADFAVRKETLANGYGVPMAFLCKESNLANLQAARQQHALLAVLPRCLRNAAQINQFLCPLFDERLFVAYDNPVPEDVTLRTAVQTADAATGDTTINERREVRGLPPVEWGEKPWLGMALSQVGDEKPAPVVVPPAPEEEEEEEEEPKDDAA